MYMFYSLSYYYMLSNSLIIPLLWLLILGAKMSEKVLLSTRCFCSLYSIFIDASFSLNTKVDILLQLLAHFSEPGTLDFKEEKEEIS